MEEQGCCSACAVQDPTKALVPVAWHLAPGDPRERLCTVCFSRLFPGETMASFDLSVLPKWVGEGFAPAHVMVLRERQKLLVLVSQLDDHHVSQFRRFATDAHEEGVEEELLRQLARDYRTTKDAIAHMATRAWWDQMRIWPMLTQKKEKK